MRSVYGAGFRSRWGHFLELNEGKNEGGSGKSRGSGIKGVCKHIMEMRDIVAQLKKLEVEMFESFLVIITQKVLFHSL